ncbi:xanthine dehydrogenase family protein molybdopterin-binding subunit [Treponema parvum]|uniref:Xanthine dehydrogenase family protein molybdopterin-binding subunit n=1 Tax=Treponema parvum TaxID=138851 RepID=A0A975IE99_9SPIR|nr:xanthine dehydrogenase family protein [Treponema parvum]QTQ13830.1 xanthine dehydrogenase family protein molybdopterin-binding subunit [Treponema parvum]
MLKKKTDKTKAPHTSISDEFYSDIDLPGTLYAAVIRSPSDSGLFAGLETPVLPEGYGIFTAEDIPGEKKVKIMNTQIPVFSDARIQYFGEPVGIITGPDERILSKLKKQVHVIIHDADEGKVEAKLLKEKEIKTGIALKNLKAFDELFSRADKSVSGSWNSSLQMPSYSEPEGVFCHINNGILSVCTPTKWIKNLRNTLASVLNFSSEKISITKTVTQQYTKNGSWKNAIISAQAALAAFKTGKPIKLCFSEEEQRKFIDQGLPIEISYKTAIDKEGRISAMDIAIKINASAQCIFIDEMIDMLMIASCGVYNIKNLRIKAKVYDSKLPPSPQNINDTAAQAFFALENQMNNIAAVMDIQPHELRTKNMCPVGKKSFMPFKLALPETEKILESVINVSDFKRKFVTYRIDCEERIKSPEFQRFALRGIGLASAFNGSGSFAIGGFSNDYKIDVTLESDSTLTIHALPPSQTVTEIWKKTAAEILGLDVSNIRIDSIFENDREPSLPENVYSNLSEITQLLKKCCTAIQSKRFRNPLPISVSRSASSSQKKQWYPETLTGQPFTGSAFASTAVELELDPCTFQCKLKGIWITIDAGEILVTEAAQNNVYLEIDRVLCMLFENEKLDCPKISVNFIDSQDDPKQVQGLVLNTLPAAFMSALSQAMAQQINVLPIATNYLSLKENFKIRENFEKDENAHKNNKTEQKIPETAEGKQ